MKSKLFSVLLTAVALSLVSAPAYAQAMGGGNVNDYKGMVGIAAGLAIGLAALGCGLAQGRAAAAALEGIARNPNASGKIQTPMIIALALTESLVLLSFLIAFFLQGKI